MNTQDFHYFLETLTLEQAQFWAMATEKFAHISDTYDEVLSETGSTISKRVEMVEERFEHLLFINDEEDQMTQEEWEEMNRFEKAAESGMGAKSMGFSNEYAMEIMRQFR